MLSPYEIVFSYQSRSIDLGSWLSLWTLCFAPLVAHIFVGTAEPVYLDESRPHWTDRVVQFNPTSILWRYFAILDRRIRSRSWDKHEMAASNALFWKGKGWDGSEEMMRSSKVYCTRLPNKSHIGLASSSAVQSVVIALQGAQALYELLGLDSFASSVSLASIFLPLALLGLLRLPAAYWLTNEFSFADSQTHFVVLGEGSTLDTRRLPDDNEAGIGEHHDPDGIALLTQMPPIAKERSVITASEMFTAVRVHPVSTNADALRLHPWLVSSWRGVLVRVCFLIPLLGMAGLSTYYLLPTNPSTAFFTATTFSLVLFYTVFTISTTFVFIFAFIRSRSNTTVLPGITSLWYKLYTALLGIMMLELFIVASLETIKMPCGAYTTVPDGQGVCTSIQFLENVTVHFNTSSIVDGNSMTAVTTVNVTKGFFGGEYHAHSLIYNGNGTLNNTDDWSENMEIGVGKS